ncbi:hypothetical protein SERLADRAFT_345287 [Serpula lacrymans var. lacrymans S7.9]|uniref:F-box domain-containing protein n=1 Tax=Serpula lacrymans var. lacrymans (strain S7.9) TaxID=578457 RepID=F8NES6_SERL9|nr:uncharacterized protein SERLADRAFT_345287 [Serpula lacrymans var. lacrymans S7.9]EGO31074.1 hypothetical protein SERLADRAFT_345287 [Serpula lacrymans var. lacrymans S7.9]
MRHKGKDKELPPSLPPLSFTPAELGYGTIDWPSPEPVSPNPGPSSYGSGHTSLLSTAQSPFPSIQSPDAHPDSRPGVTEDSRILTRMPSRRRSLSSLSVQSTRSLAARSMSRIKTKFNGPRSPGSFARKLFSKARPESASTSPVEIGPSVGLTADPNLGDLAIVGQGSCFLPWRTDYKRSTPLPPYLSVNADGVLSTDNALLYHPPQYPDGANLKGKGRSYSSPFPTSVLDIVPAVPDETFVPLPIVVHNSFDETLPRELKLHILSFVVSLYHEDHERKKSTGSWTANKASSSKNKWVGRDRGMRELVKLSRVSKAWQALVFDGQLWMDVNLRSFPKLPTALLLRLSETPGAFVKKIDLTGHVYLSPSTMLNLTNNLCSGPESSDSPYTQLIDVNLQGCSALTSQSLHNLIIHSPFLRNLCLKGLEAVTNVTCDLLALSPHLTSLNLSRCPNMDAQGILSLSSAVLRHGNRLALKELRLSGLQDVLDIGYARNLHNSAVDAFIACTEEDENIETVTLTARQAGRESRDVKNYRRRLTSLRHIVLSSCVLLTDIACSHLAHAVPRLEILELGGIGSELKDEGLIRLLETTPLIKKIDLEDACEITDAVIAAITPAPLTDTTLQRGVVSNEAPQAGHALEHLVVSYASNLSNEAFKSLISNCPRLRVLEADSTAMSGSVLKQFVRLTRSRNMCNPTVVAVDCRGIGESVVKELSVSTRPRRGWRSWEARKLGYLDGRDEEELKVGQDECDDKRVVLKSFYSWQTVDAVRAARDRQRKSTRRARNVSGGGSDTEDAVPASGRSGMRWWSPSGRRSSGNTSPTTGDANDRDGCTIM